MILILYLYGLLKGVREEKHAYLCRDVVPRPSFASGFLRARWRNIRNTTRPWRGMARRHVAGPAALQEHHGHQPEDQTGGRWMSRADATGMDLSDWLRAVLGARGRRTS